MERSLMGQLVSWKNSTGRKPLILNGARQVGKTWLLKEFGSREYKNVAYVNLDNDEAVRGLFASDHDVSRIVSGLSLLLGMDIVPEDTLVILDEIQSEPRAITALKYFCEEAPEYHVTAAGSLLGLVVHEGSGYPVGKVDTLDLYPLSFAEFLSAMGEGRFASLVSGGDQSLMNTLSGRLTELLKQYYVVGGMPEAVLKFSESGAYNEVRKIQSRILEGYARDFAKHIPARIIQRTLEVWNSIPAHLAQENKKFVFGRVREGARAKEYEESLLWLEQAGLIVRVGRVSKPAIPLAAYDDHRAFKVFLVDVGLLGALSELSPASILEGSRVFTEFKGALTEQYVCQQLISSCGLRPFYWSAENSRGEIDFLVSHEGEVYPLEVKAEENLRAKSLRAFCEKYPNMRARRFSLSGFRDEGWMVNVPLYAVGDLLNWA